MKSKADKTDIFRLETEKAEKLYVDGEFQRLWREIDSLKQLINQLEKDFEKLNKKV